MGAKHNRNHVFVYARGWKGRLLVGASNLSKPGKGKPRSQFANRIRYVNSGEPNTLGKLAGAPMPGTRIDITNKTSGASTRYLSCCSGAMWLTRVT